MKLSTFFSASLLLSAFAAGCAVDSNAAAPVADGTQLDEASETLGRAAVKGTYIRSVSSSSCNTATSLELGADGTFVTTVDYVPIGRLCADLP